MPNHRQFLFEMSFGGGFLQIGSACNEEPGKTGC